VLRGYQGAAQYAHDLALGEWAGREVQRIAPSLCYAFTHVGLETLRWSEANGIPTVLESPNGHLRAFRDIYAAEHERWCGGTYRGHPTLDMVLRVEEEYRLADRVRASSLWTRDSLAARGVPVQKVHVLQQPVDLDHFRPDRGGPPDGPLRAVFVGSLDLRKGFVYLMRAVRRMNNAVALEMVGGTVDRCTRSLFERERAGLDITLARGDPRPAYHRAELSVLPTLEDGSPFAAAEAMACGLPLVISAACGAREWVTDESTGWVVPDRSAEALEAALRKALLRRGDLRSMGETARRFTERRADPDRCGAALRSWVLSGI
jgi:glycosyltransferase involved in cell wall biosynthesis